MFVAYANEIGTSSTRSPVIMIEVNRISDRVCVKSFCSGSLCSAIIVHSWWGVRIILQDGLDMARELTNPFDQVVFQIIRLGLADDPAADGVT